MIGWRGGNPFTRLLATPVDFVGPTLSKRSSIRSAEKRVARNSTAFG